MAGFYFGLQKIYAQVIKSGQLNCSGEVAAGTEKNEVMKIHLYLTGWLTVIFFVTVVLLSDVLCEEPSIQDEKAPDSIDAIIENRDELAYDPAKHSIFPQFYHPLSRKLGEWVQKHGLEITVNYDVLVQGLT